MKKVTIEKNGFEFTAEWDFINPHKENGTMFHDGYDIGNVTVAIYCRDTIRDCYGSGAVVAECDDILLNAAMTLLRPTTEEWEDAIDGR